MKLIVNADDFGLSKGSNYGIYEAHINGIVTSTTLMVTMPAVLHAKRLAEKAPKLAIGLHLNIALGKPLTSCKTLVKPCGNFYKPKDKPNQDLFSEEEIYNEFLAQYELFLEIMKRKPTHIDSHLYTHQVYKKAKNAALRLAKEKNIAIRSFNYDNYQAPIFLDWFKYRENKDLKQTFIQEFNKLEQNKTYELMVHPAFLDEFILNKSSYNLGRLIELDVLTCKETKRMIDDRKVELTNFLSLGGKNV